MVLHFKITVFPYTFCFAEDNLVLHNTKCMGKLIFKNQYIMMYMCNLFEILKGVQVVRSNYYIMHEPIRIMNMCLWNSKTVLPGYCEFDWNRLLRTSQPSGFNLIPNDQI